MIRTFVKFLIFSIALVLLQATVFNHICLFNVAVPMAFIYVILRLPITMNVGWVLTVGFLLGLSVDIFSDTQGMNALACTLLAMLRKPVFTLYFPREDEIGNPEPTISSLGAVVFIKYDLTMSLLYCFMIFLIEAFTFLNPLLLVLRILCSTVLTTLLILAIDSLTVKRYAKRL
ncbi:MAG: rod shape-determining protein MreD [Candidatus Amulumruptor caecigallinarius]|uniref:Rod shape-determining protein MreD n=1 Tax=Candidatus Amulumruptor caecigallinarius TaxID=2109911 RepID=A0A4Q0UA09_9BACT|nr:MAG: rod shape-determining protein MreD [Candidatus Amulumruptor caecigallinarius]HJE40136.1 rod shape-determining protein MreD [Candidatus Amulumruptor caecigallinarius]